MNSPFPPAGGALDDFRSLVAADAALQSALAGFERPEPFAVAAAEAAAARGIVLPIAALEGAPRPDPLFLSPPPSFPAGPGWPPAAWLPVGLVAEAGQWAVEWAHFAGAPLAEPFFRLSAQRALARPLNRLLALRTSLGDFVRGAEVEAPPPPDGLIFHMSRCGSTLVARMLAALPGAIALSEPPPLDALVRLAAADPALAPADRAALLRAMVAALCRRPAGASGPRFVKLDFAHARVLPWFRAAFPDTPWLFLHRDPVAVLVSQMRMSGLGATPGFGDLALSCGGEEAASARMIASACVAAADAAALGGGLFVDYAALPGAVEAAILPHFRVAPDPAGRAAMARAARRDAKAPGRAFVAGGAKGGEAGEKLLVAARTWLDPVRRRLLALSAAPPQRAARDAMARP